MMHSVIFFLLLLGRCYSNIFRSDLSFFFFFYPLRSQSEDVNMLQVTDMTVLCGRNEAMFLVSVQCGFGWRRASGPLVLNDSRDQRLLVGQRGGKKLKETGAPCKQTTCRLRTDRFAATHDESLFELPPMYRLILWGTKNKSTRK